MKSRKNNYELLRILATIFIIALHVSGGYLTAITDDTWLGGFYTEHIFITSLYNSLGRFAVPCFIMLSGSFTLDNLENANYKYYYSKIFRGIGIQTVLFSTFYFICTMLYKILAIIIMKRPVEGLFFTVKSAIIGQPYYHLWYLWMMNGVFLLAPLAIRFKEDIGEKLFKKVTILFFAASMLGLWTSVNKLEWNPGYSFCYLSYFLLGYIIRKNVKVENRQTIRKSRLCTVWGGVKNFMLIVGGFFVLILMAYLRYIQGINGITNEKLQYSLQAPYAPLTIISSLLIFTGFSRLNFNRNVTKISSLTFEIYLFHAGIWELLRHFITIEMDSRIVIPLMTAVVFFLSLLAAVIYKKMWKMVEERWALSARICKVISRRINL